MEDLAKEIHRQMLPDDAPIEFDPATIILIVQLLTVLVPLIRDRCGMDAASVRREAQSVADRRPGWRMKKLVLKLALRQHLSREEFKAVRGGDILEAATAVAAQEQSEPLLSAALAG
jgi:hypothetical protein